MKLMSSFIGVILPFVNILTTPLLLQIFWKCIHLNQNWTVEEFVETTETAKELEQINSMTGLENC